MVKQKTVVFNRSNMNPPGVQVRSFQIDDIVLGEVEGLDSTGANVRDHVMMDASESFRLCLAINPKSWNRDCRKHSNFGCTVSLCGVLRAQAGTKKDFAEYLCNLFLNVFVTVFLVPL